MPNHLLTKYKASELHYIMKAPLNFGCTLMIFFSGNAWHAFNTYDVSDENSRTNF